MSKDSDPLDLCAKEKKSSSIRLFQRKAGCRLRRAPLARAILFGSTSIPVSCFPISLGWAPISISLETDSVRKMPSPQLGSNIVSVGERTAHSINNVASGFGVK